jgi:hypothetical protein
MATAPVIQAVPEDTEKKYESSMPGDLTLSKGIESPETGSIEGLDVLKLATDQHPAHPRHWPFWKRWGILFVLCTFQAYV